MASKLGALVKLSTLVVPVVALKVNLPASGPDLPQVKAASTPASTSPAVYVSAAPATPNAVTFSTTSIAASPVIVGFSLTLSTVMTTVTVSEESLGSVAVTVTE